MREPLHAASFPARQLSSPCGRRPGTNLPMTTHGIDDDVIRTIREFNRPVRFNEIADRLQIIGISRSQVHNSIYRLGKNGRLRRAGKGSSMTYVLALET